MATAPARRKRVPILEPLEPRWLLSAPASQTIALDPTLDQFGDQVVTVMSYTNGTAPDSSQDQVGTFGIFDTGASSVTFSPDDAAQFDFFNESIPIKNPGGAVADGIGGGITGDVSQPGTIVADGMHASTLTFTSDGFPDFGFDFTTAASTALIQAFVGTSDGSPDLPTITGTPLLHPNAANPGGLAALVNMQGSTLDFSDIAPGLVLQEPDIHFVAPSSTLAADAQSTDPITIPLTFYGDDNFDNPGQFITDTHLTTQNDVSVTADATQTGSGPLTEVDHQNFLFDTGSQLTVISTATAQALGLDLNHPTTTLDVQGVGGTETVPGFTVSSLVLPTSAGGTLTFTNVPVYVLDVADGIDGILGMNLLDTADSFLYNPYDPVAGQPTVTFTFLTNPDRSGSLDGSGLNALLDQHGLNFFAGAFAGHSVPDFGGSSIQFDASTFAADESQGSLTIHVDRTGNLSAAGSVHFATAGGTAKDGVNYSAVSGTLNFAPGQKVASFSIPVLDDHVLTGDLSLNLALSQPGGGATLGTPATATVTIHNTDMTVTPTPSTPGGGAQGGQNSPTPMNPQADQQPASPPQQATAALVTVRDVTPDVSHQGTLTAITIALSGPVDASGAASLVHYHLVRGHKTLPLRSAVYDPGSLTITLRPRVRVNLAHEVRLTIAGLVDSLGRGVDANHDGQPGGDVVAILR
jgi:hypothetical protein